MTAALEVTNLRVALGRRGGAPGRIAVDGVSFSIERGETVALVGESGAGKSLTALALLGLVPPGGRIETGEVLLGGENLLALPRRRLRSARGNRIAMIFQDPLGALHPLLSIGRQLTEVLEVHRGMGPSEARRAAAAALGDVGIADPEARLDAYPHELSGGMRQRAMIAMALLCDPEVLVADEPTTALDATIQAQILELLALSQEKRGTAILLVTHDLGVVAQAARRAEVMYAGRIVESATVRELFARPLHPYTLGLIASAPSLEGPLAARLTSIPGAPPDPAELPRGCAFHPRCPWRTVRCMIEEPLLEPLAPERVARSLVPLPAGPRAACFEKERVAAEGRGGARAFRAAQEADR